MDKDRQTVPAIESVIFKNPSKMFGKRIGMAVYNAKQNSKIYKNSFKLAITNSHGYQLYPAGQQEMVTEDWMYCTAEDGSKSEEKFYTFE